MKKPGRLDGYDWMNKCIAWLNIPQKWSYYLDDIAIPRAYDDARALWSEADRQGDESGTLTAGFKVYALLALARRVNAYRRLISGKIRFPFTNTDVFALLPRPEPDSDDYGNDGTEISGTLRQMLEDLGAKDSLDEVNDRAVAYCRDFLSWEKSAPRLGANRECSRCGRCCTDLWDAYDFTAAERDILLWSLCGRWDIIDRIDWGAWHCWLGPKTGRTAAKCPWLKKNRGRKAFSCRIDDVKPKHCRVWRGCPVGKPGYSVVKALRRAELQPARGNRSVTAVPSPLAPESRTDRL